VAKVVGPLHSEEARGRLGANVYNTWRGIRWVKSWAAPDQPDSGEQLDVRDRLSTVSANWKLLTATQRAAWNTYANEHPLSDWSGSALRITGFNWYVKCAAIPARYGLSIDLSPPSTPAPVLPASFLVTPGSRLFTIIWPPLDPASPGPHMIQARVAGPYSAGRMPDFHHAVLNTEQWDHAGTLEVTTAAEGWFGIWMRRIRRADGLVSSWQLLHNETTPP
jgi:hypothetical protein